MALPTTLQRPVLPYTPTNVSGPIDRYTALGDIAPKPQPLDADINCIYQIVSETNTAVNGIAAGILPGASDEINANKLPTTDGEGNISWTLVENQHMDDNCCDTRNYLDGSITPGKLQPIPGSKLTSNSVPDSAIVALNGGKLTNASVDDSKITALNGSKLTNLSVTDGKIIGMSGAKLTAATVPDTAIIGMNGSKLTNLSVPTAALAAKSVTVDKMSAGNAAVNTFARSTGVGGAVDFSALPFKGIKQIQSTVIDQAALTPLGATTFQQFNIPLQVSITTQSANSTVVIFLSANMGAAATDGIYPNNACGALYKNGSLWEAASGTPVGAQISGLQQSLVQAIFHTVNINTIFMDNIANSGTTNVYSLRCYSSRVGGQIFLNSAPNNTGIASISCIYAIEIGS